MSPEKKNIKSKVKIVEDSITILIQIKHPKPLESQEDNKKVNNVDISICFCGGSIMTNCFVAFKVTLATSSA